MSQSAASHLSPAFPRRAAWGTAGALRAWQAEALKLYLDSGRTDTVVLELPGRMVGGTTGELLAALLTGVVVAAGKVPGKDLANEIAGKLKETIGDVGREKP